MPKEVTVLGLEGSVLRGIRLEESGKGFAVSASEAWDTAAPEEDVSEAQDGAEPQPESVDAVEETAIDRLAGAFAAAVQTFGTHEFVLSLPLSRLLIETVRVPVENRDELDTIAAEAINGISPFPDEAFHVGTEVVAETDKEIIAIAAALPEAVSLEMGDALDAAKARIVRTDATALGRLRSLWPRIVSGGAMGRRIVLMNLDDGWDFMAMDDDAPVMLRGLGVVSSTAELGREVMLGLIRCEHSAGPREIGEIVVVTGGEGLPEDVKTQLSSYGTVRVEAVGEDDAYAGIEGVANRTVEEATLDVTPDAWNTALKEARFKKRLTVGMAITGGIWLLAMLLLFGVPMGYGWLANRQKEASKRHQSVYKKVKDTRDRVRLVQRYSDHARGALETLKVVSDRMPSGVTLSQLQYRRGEYVRVWAEASQPTDAYKFKKSLDKAVLDDDTPLFGEVTLSEVRQTRGGAHRFDIEARFVSEDEDSAGSSGNSASGGRASSRAEKGDR